MTSEQYSNNYWEEASCIFTNACVHCLEEDLTEYHFTLLFFSGILTVNYKITHHRLDLYAVNCFVVPSTRLL